MPAASLSHVLRHLRTLTEAQATRDLSDGELLERFRVHREETAFALLVQRHGPMVLGVCRRMLADEHAAEDAFQATFLVLVRKAASIRKRDSVASWLHGVARRIAIKARLRTARDHALERRSLAMTRPEAGDDCTWHELRAILDEELEHLPEKYRTPLVLCGLEGKTHEQAARELGCPKSSLSSRLTRARELLRDRLTRRGITVSAVALAAVLSEKASAAVPALLTIATVQAALRKTAEGISANVATLTEEGIKAMSATKTKAGLALVLVATLVVSTFGYQMAAISEPAQEEARPIAAEATAESRQPRTDQHGDPLPDSAVRRLGTLRFRQGGGLINRLLLSPDRKTLISKSYYGEQSVGVWELATGKLLRQFPGDYYDNRAVALTPDGKTLAVGHDTVIQFYDIATGRAVRRLDCPLAGTEGLAFSPDGKMLASGHGNHTVLLWDWPAGKELARLPAEHNGLKLLAFSPDGNLLAVSDATDKTIRLFDVATRKERHQVTRPSAVLDFAFSPDGALLAVGAQDGAISLWDPAPGKLIREVQCPNRQVRAVAWSPDGKTLAASENDEREETDCIRLWDPATGKEQGHIEGHWWLVESLAFTADGKTLISGGRDSIIRLYDVGTGKERSPAAGLQRAVGWLALSADGKTLAYPDRETHLWDLSAGREVGTLPSFFGEAAISPDGRALVGRDGRGDLTLWDVNGRCLLRELEPDRAGLLGVNFYRVAWSPDGKQFASLSFDYIPGGARFADAAIRLWDPATGKELHRLRLNESSDEFCTPEAVAFSPDGRTLIASGRAAEPKLGKVRVWDMATWKELSDIGAAINSSIGTLEKHKFGFQFPRSPIVEPRIVFSPDGHLLAMNSGLNYIPVWEAITGRERCRLAGHDGPTAYVAFAPDGRTLASAGYDNTIRLWDVETGKGLRKLTGHRGKANALCFTPDGKTLISGGDDTTLLFWDVAAVTRRGRTEARFTPQEWDALWKDLAGADAATVHQAIARLAASPDTATALKERLLPSPKPDADRLAKWLRELDSDEFAVREQAMREFEQLGEAAQPAIERALARADASPELRRRLERLQDRLAVPTGELLRSLRAIEVLEHIATPEARQLLEKLAAGAPDARLTREAKAALERLTRR